MNQQNQQQLARKQQIDTVRGALEKLKPQMAMALPKHLTPDRLLRVTMTAVQNNPKLLDCDRTSLFAAVLTCAQLGLEPDGVLGQAYLVPFKGKVQFIAGYKGLIRLGYNSGEVSTIQAHEVCENDTFRYAYGLNEELYHVPAEGERGEITHFYAYSKFKDGGHVFVVLPLAEVERIRDEKSEGYKAFKAGAIKSNPWHDDFAAMGCKTAVRRLAKWLPMSVQRAAAFEDAYDRGQYVRTDEYGDIVLEGEAHEVETGQENAGNGAAAGKLDTLAGSGEGEPGPRSGTTLPPTHDVHQTHDIDGVPWDERIHSVNRTVTEHGQWRRKRGISEEYYQQVLAEITPPDAVVPTGEPETATTAPTGPDPNDPVTRIAQRMEEAQDRDTLDTLADETLNGTDLGERDRERITVAYKRNAQRLEAAAGGKPLFGDE